MSTPLIDHLIFFLPYNPTTHTPLIPPLLLSLFTITPGGTHADNLTANALILLSDGSYIELICFLPQPDDRKHLIEHHWWGPDANRKGWTDWCLTTLPSDDQAEAGEKEDAKSNFKHLEHLHAYDEPVSGGRKRPDGVDVQWRVTFPRPVTETERSTRGEIPFFCHDSTPRAVRVPATPSSTQHPSGILGIFSVCISVATRPDFERVRRIYAAVFGASLTSQTSGDAEEVVFSVGNLRAYKGAGGKERRSVPVTLRLVASEEKKREVEATGRGFKLQVVLAVPKREGKDYLERVDGKGDGDDLGGLWVMYV